ncbi:MAG: dihydrodipicolinate synthase family protein [Candidatus Thorarchaeota archaeon]
MDLTRLQQALQGVAITTATPFSKDLRSVDLDALTGNMEYLLRKGGKFLVPCGNTGEFYSLTFDEWKQVLRTTLDAVAGKMIVTVGIGHSIGTALEMIRYAETEGADGVMVMYPRHVFSSEEGVLNYYRKIIDAAKEVGVVLYKKGPLLTDEVLIKVLESGKVAGVKYAYGRIVDFARTAYALREDVIWSCGVAERFAPFYWLAGARGLTTGLGNFAPKISLGMFDALVRSDWTEAMRIHKMITPLEDLREGRGGANNVPVVKAVMDSLGLAGGNCRPPIHKLTEVERQAAIDAISGWGL